MDEINNVVADTTQQVVEVIEKKGNPIVAIVGVSAVVALGVGAAVGIFTKIRKNKKTKAQEAQQAVDLDDYEDEEEESKN